MGLFKRTAACLVGMALLFSTAAAETTLHFTFAGDCTLAARRPSASRPPPLTASSRKRATTGPLPTCRSYSKTMTSLW